MGSVELFLNPKSQLVTVNNSAPTISVRWNQATQQAVIATAPGPTIASRVYGLVHTAMFDAWAAYDPEAAATRSGDSLQRPGAENTTANKIEAMSYAAYRVLTELFPGQKQIFDSLMVELGFNPSNTTTNVTTPAGIGNTTAEALMQFRRADGSNQLNGYADTTGYLPINPDPISIRDIGKWTPEFIPINSHPGDPNYQKLQVCLTPHWHTVVPFALSSASVFRPDGPESFLLVEGASVDLAARRITLADGREFAITQDIVGTDPSTGAIINQAFIDQAQAVVDISAGLTDQQKLIAEFWENGAKTAFPPGTWMTFGEYISARDGHSLDEDAVLFFALGNGVFDAGIATWETKAFYDSARPVRVIRELGKLGLLNNGITGIDAITGETGFVIQAWAGSGLGTQTILAENFLTYQTPGDHPSPPFAEYTSGHSAFSAAGAEILKLFTGKDSFGASVTFQAGESRFEPGLTPTSPITLSWGTFTEAAEQAGLSRLYGGIHFADGNTDGGILGRAVGNEVWSQVQTFVSGVSLAPIFAQALLTPGLREGLPFGAVVASYTLFDADGNFDSVFITAGNLDQDGDGRLPFALKPLKRDSHDFTLASVDLVINDADDIDFEAPAKGKFGLELSVVDTVGRRGITQTTLNFGDVANQTRFRPGEQDFSNGVLSLAGDFNDGHSDPLLLRFSINLPIQQTRNSSIAELGVFVVDDDQGKLGETLPGEAGYLEKVLEQIEQGKGKAIFSTLPLKPNGFSLGDTERFIEVSGHRLGFFLISDSTIDEVSKGVKLGQKPEVTILFSTLKELVLTPTAQGANLSFPGDSGAFLQSLSVNLELLSLDYEMEDDFHFSKLQGDLFCEVVDLRQANNPVKVTATVFREADMDNLVGFYRVSDVYGSVDSLMPGAPGFDLQAYRQAALNSRVMGLELLSTDNQSSTSFTGFFEPGAILAPFIVVNGSFQDALNGQAEVYFPYLGANSDRADHIRLLGNNIFGFEDLINGGDRDFNDMIVALKFH